MSLIDKIKKKIEDKAAPLREFFDKDQDINYEYGETIDHHMNTVEEFKNDIVEMEKEKEHKYIDPFENEEIEQKEE